MDTVSAIRLAALLGGLSLSIWALKRYASTAPMTLQPVWKMKDRFVGPGFRLFLAGTALIVLSASAGMIRDWID